MKGQTRSFSQNDLAKNLPGLYRYLDFYRFLAASLREPSGSLRPTPEPAPSTRIQAWDLTNELARPE